MNMVLQRRKANDAWVQLRGGHDPPPTPSTFQQRVASMERRVTFLRGQLKAGASIKDKATRKLFGDNGQCLNFYSVFDNVVWVT